MVRVSFKHSEHWFWLGVGVYLERKKIDVMLPFTLVVFDWDFPEEIY